MKIVECGENFRSGTFCTDVKEDPVIFLTGFKQMGRGRNVSERGAVSLYHRVYLLAIIPRGLCGHPLFRVSIYMAFPSFKDGRQVVH